jgi:drug/metabolite transporter (DMT)-like permease
VALGASLWAVDLVLRQPLTGSLPSSAIVLYEHLVLTAVLAIPLWGSREKWRGMTRRQWLVTLWIALGGSALGTVCYTQAMKISNPTSVVLIQKIQPLFAVLLARYGLGERETARGRYWLRFVVALGAASVISFGDGFPREQLSDPKLTAALLALAAAAIWGSCTVAGRYVAPVIGVVPLTALRIVLALPMLAVMSWAQRGVDGFPLPTGAQVFPLLLMALIPGLAGLLVYYRGLRDCPASLATLAELCFPAGSALLGWFFLGVEVTMWQIVGVVALWCAVLWRTGPAKLDEPTAS